MKLIRGRLECSECGQCEYTPYGDCPPCLPEVIWQAKIDLLERNREIDEGWRQSEEGIRLQRELDEALKRYNDAMIAFKEPRWEKAQSAFVKIAKDNWEQE